jgi:hypothetical protein
MQRAGAVRREPLDFCQTKLSASGCRPYYRAMIRGSFLLMLLCIAGAGCSSSDSDSPAAESNAGSNGNGGGSAGSSCPDMSGAWNVSAHCDASLIGETLLVAQNACALSFAEPFDGFTGSLASDGTITLSGPQSCTGTMTGSAISMNCTPGACTVKLMRLTR